MQSTKRNFARFAWIFGLLVLLPAVFSLLLCLHVIDSQRISAQEKISDQIEDRARILLASLDAESIFAPEFSKLSSKLLPLTAMADTLSPASLSMRISEIASAAFADVGQSFLLTAFDSSGKPIYTGLATDEEIQAFKFLWECICGASVSNDYTGRRATIAKLLGRGFSLRPLRNSSDVCQPTFTYNRHGLFYHCRDGEGKNGIIVFLEHSLKFDEVLKKYVKLATNIENPIKILTSDDKSLYASSPDVFIQDNLLWKKIKVRDNELLFGQSVNLGRYEKAKVAVALLISLLIISSLLIFYRNMIGGRTAWLSIRYKLVAIFVFAVYLPLLGLFLLGFNGLRDHRAVLENEARKGIQDLLFKIDSDFAQKETEIFAIFEQFYNDRSWHNQLAGSWKQADTALRKSARANPTGENFFNYLEIRDIQQNQLYSTAQGEANDRIKASGRTMSLLCLEKFAPQKLQNAGIKLKQSDIVLINMLENPVIGFSHLFEQPGKMVQMDLEGSNLYWYWNFYPEEDSKVAFFCCNSKVQYNTENYLNTALKNRFNLGNTSLKLVANYPDSHLWIPENTGNAIELHRLIKLSKLNGTVESGRINFNGQRYIATCLPGIKLKEAYISCLYPEAEIDDKIATMHSQIYLGMALILLISVLTGLLLSKTFLQPVSELSFGLKALRKRNTDFRVQIANQDELGELGKTFNQMMVDVKEMLIAGAVQQCLIPSTCPAITGYECLIYNKMAADVGGDYADFFALPDNRNLIVLGDVTGHGVSSSILTAMVKALVFRFAAKDASLQTILKSLSIMIFDLLKHRKLMTFCALILDQKNNSFTLANAGHPFPIMCSASGATRLIEHSSLPLGVSIKRSNYTVIEGKLDPGEILLLYTDGIAEATNSAGKEFGFNRLEQLIAEHRAKSVAEIKEVLLGEFWQHYQREELDDDLTFILLKRNSACEELPE